jgi:hypothetical protein
MVLEADGSGKERVRQDHADHQTTKSMRWKHALPHFPRK